MSNCDFTGIYYTDVPYQTSQMYSDEYSLPLFYYIKSSILAIF